MTKRFAENDANRKLVTVWTPWGEQLVPRKNSRSGRVESIRRAIQRLKAAKEKKRRQPLQA